MKIQKGKVLIKGKKQTKLKLEKGPTYPNHNNLMEMWIRTDTSHESVHLSVTKKWIMKASVSIKSINNPIPHPHHSKSTHLKSKGNCELDIFFLWIVIFSEILLIFNEIFETALILLFYLELVFLHPFAL